MTTLICPSSTPAPTQAHPTSDVSRQRTRDGRACILKLQLAPGFEPSWLRPGMTLRVPVPDGPMLQIGDGRPLVRGVDENAELVPLVWWGKHGVESAYSWPMWRDYILEERYATWRRRPLFTWLPVSYCVVPPSVRHLIATGLNYRTRTIDEPFPGSLFDGGFEALRGLVSEQNPDKEPSRPLPRICLTHDIDTRDGFAWVRRIAEVEMSHGLRSSWNVVTGQYRIDFDTLDWLAQNGFEIGLHDHVHDNKLIYLSESDMRRRLDRCKPFIDRYGVRGFRSPSWLRNAKLMRVLSDYVTYDCSTLDFDWLCPAGPGGVLTPNPFRFGRLVEIPTTLPFEAPTLTGMACEDMVEYWEPKISWLTSVNGQAVVNTHPDRSYGGSEAMVAAYGRLLERLLDAYCGKWSLPGMLAEEV